MSISKFGEVNVKRTQQTGMSITCFAVERTEDSEQDHPLYLVWQEQRWWPELVVENKTKGEKEQKCGTTAVTGKQRRY